MTEKVRALWRAVRACPPIRQGSLQHEADLASRTPLLLRHLSQDGVENCGMLGPIAEAGMVRTSR
jgi:hypothetical protein